VCPDAWSGPPRSAKGALEQGVILPLRYGAVGAPGGYMGQAGWGARC
jgi:hypothetical protein